jgi:hypothetical protein
MRRAANARKKRVQSDFTQVEQALIRTRQPPRWRRVLLIACIFLLSTLSVGYALIAYDISTGGGTTGVKVLRGGERFLIETWPRPGIHDETRLARIDYTPDDFGTPSSALVALADQTGPASDWHTDRIHRLIAIKLPGKVFLVPRPFDDAVFFQVLACLGACAGLLCWWRARRDRQRLLGLYCSECGYAIPNTLSRCPECGSTHLRVSGRAMGM